MKKTFVTGAAVVGAMLANPALANDENAKFSGFTATVLVGLDKVKAEDGAGNSGDESDVAYGAAVGYDFDLGSVVVGAEAELTDSAVETSATDVLVVGDSFSLKADRDIYVGARIGVRVIDNALLYAKAGYTNTRLKGTYSFGGSSASDSEDLGGFRVGAGVEVAIEKVFGRLEYRYSDYGELNFQGTPTGVSFTRHQVLFGLGYRF